MPNNLDFTDLLKRAEETSKKITGIEGIYDDFAVELRAPAEVGQLKDQIDQILTKSNVAASKLLSHID